MDQSSKSGGQPETPTQWRDLEALIRSETSELSLTNEGRLRITGANGQAADIAAADPLLDKHRDTPESVLSYLDSNRDALLKLVQAGDPGDVIDDLSRGIEAAGSEDNSSADGNFGDGRATTLGNLGSTKTLGRFVGLPDSNLSEVSPLRQETAQIGRDDIKRGEVGASGQNVGTPTGQGLNHLTGLGDQEPGLRNGEAISSSNNTRFQGLNTGVGQEVDHLWLLGDFEYYRAADDFLTADPIMDATGRGSPAYGPLFEDVLDFRSVEDIVFSGSLFGRLAGPVSVSGITTRIDPTVGSVVVRPDGTFTFTPANGFSGEATFTVDLTDPRTGEKLTRDVTIAVAAVADPVAISGAATTPEDTVVGVPVSLSLGDPDGSETIEQVVISGIPAGATFNFTPDPNVNFALQPDGTYIVTGDTGAIITALQTLTLLPPHNFSGRITLGLDVTVAETNVPPGTEILVPRVSVHHDYHVDVVAVADVPDVTGDVDEVTPEDTRVLLDELAGNLNDNDGSEVLSFEISGVNGDAKLEDNLGNEYPFTLQPDGTKTYRIPPAQIGDVFFNPPPDDFGTFDMTITAIATEQSNNDQATNTAPIRVRVTPVPDPINLTAANQSVDEDNSVNIGGGIGISFNDPDGSEVLTNVTVSGFPQDSIIRYTDFTGTPQTITSPNDGFSLSFNGATEAQIRAALATLSVQPPPHSDVNIPLDVSVTMLDGGTVSSTTNTDLVVQVAAVADTPTLTAPAHSGIEDQDIALPFQVGHPDTDGTEVIEGVVITGVPSGFVLTGAAAGATLTDTGGGSYTVTGTSDAAINTLLNTLVLDIQPGGARDDLDTNFSLGVAVTTFEQTPTTSGVAGHPDNPGGEVTTPRTTANFTLPVTVHPDADLPTVGGSTTVNEDAIVNPANQAVTAPVNFGANITVSENDKTDGSEAITSIVISKIPAGRTITYTDPAGVPVTHVVDTDGPSITLSGGTEDQIRTALATLTLQPIAHDDADVTLDIRITKTDQTTSEGEAADVDFVDATHTIIFNAVADGPNFSLASSGVEDTNIPFAITSSLIDRDGSETYDFVRLTLDPGADVVVPAVLPNNIQLLSANLLPGGQMEYRFAPGVGTTTAQFEAFLASGIAVRPPLDSDVNFDVEVEIGTIESNPTEAGGFSLERLSRTDTVEVEVTPAVDTWSIASTSTFNEDGILNPALAPTAPGNTQPFAFGTDLDAGITRGETAVGDTSETVSGIVITGFPDITDLNFTPTPGATVTTAAGQVTITSALADPAAAEAAIRQALRLMSLDPTQHSDVDIPLNVQISVTDTDPDDAADTTTQTFNGTHLIEVAAVADQPSGSGSGSGLEDQTLNVSIAVSHPDNADGSEEIRDVVIANVPAGLLLTGTAAGATLTANGGGTYTVTGTSDAAINALLGNLQLEIDPGNNAREHLDTEFTLQVTATTIENAPTVDGHPGRADPAASEVARLTNSVTFPVGVTVTAVADDVTHSGQSVFIEDIASTFGSDITYGLIDTDGTENVTEVTVTGFPPGAVINYSDVNGVPQPPLTIVTGLETITFAGPKSAAGEAAIRTAVDTLRMDPPAQSDTNFDLTVTATTTDNDASTNTTTWQHPVIIQAVADAPSIDADDISGLEDSRIPLTIRADRSADGNTDNSETLSVRLTLPQDSGTPIGSIIAVDTGPFTAVTAGNTTTISGAPEGDVTLTDLGNGRYLVEGPGSGNAANDEAAIDAVLTGGVLNLDPRAQFAGSFTGAAGIRVEAISTEAATVYGDTNPAADDELAPNTLADPDTRIEIVETNIGFVITPVLDTPQFNGNSSVVQENNNSADLDDPDLRLALGTELGIAMADRDGSQDLNLTLTGIPRTAAIDFGAGTINPADPAQVIDGVTVDVIDTGTSLTITLSGTFNDALANDAIDVLQRLGVTLADDDDTDFTVGISGTTTEAIGGATANFTDDHQVRVQAAADRPTISVSGSGNEDTFIDVPISVTLNDTDGQAQGSGSETLQSVQITGIPTETTGTGEPSGNPPQAQFQIEGVTYDWATDTAIAITNAEGSFSVNRAVDGRLIFTPQTAGDAGDTRAIQAALQTFKIKRGDHVGDDYTLSVQAVSVESNPSEANDNGAGVVGDQISRATATQTTDVTVDVVPVTDPIEVTSPAAVVIDEDDVRDENGDGVVGVQLSTLFSGSITQHDRDGSETLRYEVSGLTGGTFTAGTFAGGTWTFTAAEYANARWVPPTHAAGTFTGTLTAFTQDQANGGTAAAELSDSATFSLTVKPDPDVPNASGSSTIYEDQPAGVGNEGNFGRDITYSLVDTDGSEEITQVVINAGALPAGWVISFNDGSTFTTLNTGGTLPTGVAHAGGIFTITGTRAEIDAAVDAFVVAAAANSDANASVSVSVTTTDTTDDTFTDPGDDTDGDGDFHTATRTYTHNITTLAIADTPDIQAGFVVQGNENDTFTLQGLGGETLQADRSADTDGVGDGAGWGSEELSVRITGVPFGVTLSGAGVANNVNGTFTVTAANENQLNARLDAIQVTPGDWAGEATLTVTAIATEQGEGGGGTEIHVETATDVDTLTLRVLPEVDAPTITGNAIGDEDSNIKIPLRVDLADSDGSETLDHVDVSGLPAGASFVDAGGAAIGTDLGGGVFRFTPAEMANLHIRPPLNWSSQLPAQGDITLQVQATVTDTVSTGTATLTTFPPTNITVTVQEVADAPQDFPITVNANEDQPYALGQGILNAAGAATPAQLSANTLADTDGSETLSFVLRGIPDGVIPTSSAGTISFLGGGEWSVPAAAIPTLVLPPDPNYSGSSPYSGAAISVQALAQEIAGDEAASASWPVSFNVQPVINDVTVDGLVNWNPSVTVTEAKDAAAGTNVSLANVRITAGNFVDNDGSEEVMSYTFDMTSFIADAEVLGRVRELMGNPAADATQARDWVIANGIAGAPGLYTDNGNGTFTVAATLDGNGNVTTTAESKLAGLSLLAAIFDDSDVDFDLDVTARVRDRADFGGVPSDVFTDETTTFEVRLNPIADTPTVFAQNPDNNGDTADVDTFGVEELIPLVIGGDTTDRDASHLGRTQSEEIYYVLALTGVTGGTAPDLVLLDSGGATVGLDNGDGSWTLSAAEIADLNLYSPRFAGGPLTLDFTVTTVARDFDSFATNDTGGEFQLIIDPAGLAPGTPPPVPVLNVAALLGQTEDTTGALANAGTPFVTPGDGPDADTLPDPVAALTVAFEVPAGVDVIGAVFNPNTNRWIASADDFNNGNVSIRPPLNSNSPVQIQIQAIAVGADFQRTETPIQTVLLPVEAVADNPQINGSASGNEDQPIDLNLNVSLADTDGSEVVGSHVYVRLNNGATLLGGHPVETETVDGVVLANYYKVPSAALGTLQIQGAPNWHGDVTVEVAATSQEQSNGDMALRQSSFTATIAADADAPDVTVPAVPVAGIEDTAIDLSGLLGAALTDLVTTNGAEVLSVTIENVPDGTLFSAGSNTGDGVWAIPVAALATLTVTPPTNFAGDLTLRLRAIALETTNGDNESSFSDFTVQVAPRADVFELLPQNATVGADGRAELELDVRLTDDRGTLAGEQPPEEIEITFRNVPTGVTLEATGGGTVTDNTGGEFVFRGTEDQANALAFAAGPTAAAGTSLIQIVSAETIDGADRNNPGFTDSFRLTVPQVVAGTDPVDDTLTGGADTQLLFGLGGADTLSGGADADGLFGGLGADILTGGAGADVFGWETGDVDGSVDTITDFSLADDDAIDISDVLTGFDEATSVLSEFVQLTANGGGTRVAIDANGGGDSFTDIAQLDGTFGLDANTMQANGNLIV